MKSESPDEILSCATEAAIAAGQYARRNWRRRSEAIAISQHDVKLKLDIECQERAVAVIHRRFPNHAVLGEETTSVVVQNTGSQWLWIVDPIDGTVNFSHGLPFWCCSVAARLRDETVAGAVYAPLLGELYTAGSRTPATLNGARISVSAVSNIEKAVVLTGLDKNAHPGKTPFAFFERISLAAQRTRVIGSAALDICQVACGRADGYFETGIYLWDIAAAELIARRAGGRTEVLESFDGHRLSFIASNGHLHRALRQLILPPRGKRE